MKQALDENTIKTKDKSKRTTTSVGRGRYSHVDPYFQQRKTTIKPHNYLPELPEIMNHAMFNNKIEFEEKSLMNIKKKLEDLQRKPLKSTQDIQFR